MQDIGYIINTGGEATTRTDLKEVFIAEHEALPSATLQLSTNALMPNRALDTVKCMLDLGVKMDVGVSLDGVGEKHDNIRGVKGNFKNADYLLRELLELKKTYGNRLNVGIGTVLIDKTIPNIDEVAAYAKSIGVNHKVQWYNATPFYGNSGTSQENERDIIIKIVQALPPSLVNEKWLKWLKNEPIAFTCFSMYTFFVLKSNGDVAPCLTHWNVKAGNVRENTPTEIWKSVMAKEARKIVKGCKGCLNDWGTNWSFSSSHLPYLSYYIKNPSALAKLKPEEADAIEQSQKIEAPA